MGLCDNSTFLTIIMYSKYIILSSFIILLIISFKTKNDDTNYIKKIVKVLFIILIIYLSLHILSYFINTSFRNCFQKSNPIKLSLSNSLSKTYNSDIDMYYTDNYIERVLPYETYKTIGGKKIYLYNQNKYPLSNINFTFSDDYDSYEMESSGNEIATLASVISSVTENEENDPIKIISDLKESNLDLSTGIDMNLAINYFSNKYDFLYKEISSDEMIGGLNKGGIIIAKVNAGDFDNSFTCSNGYIIIYKYDSEGNFLVLSSNDKDYETICPSDTKGFSHSVMPNINTTSFNEFNLTKDITNYYLIWR